MPENVIKWELYDHCDNDNRSERREKCGVLHFLYRAHTKALIVPITYENLLQLQWKIYQEMTTEERYLEKAIPAGESWMAKKGEVPIIPSGLYYETTAKASVQLEAATDEYGDLTLPELRATFRVSRQDLLKIASVIRLWLAPEVKF